MMIVERTDTGMTRITRGDGTAFEYRSVCSPADGEFAAAVICFDPDARMAEIVEDTCVTLVRGGYFYPDGFKWLRDNWGLSLDGGSLALHPAAYEFARAAVED